MKISYAITVCNEFLEIQKLIPILFKNKGMKDNIVVLFDQKNGSEEVSNYLRTFSKFPGFQFWRGLDFDGHFANWKNQLTEYCDVPRVNTVEGLTQEHINKWGWKVDNKGWVNYPDYQWRIWKNKPEIKWVNKVHEKLDGFKTYTTLPSQEELSIYHPKDIKRQEKQNNYYDTL